MIFNKICQSWLEVWPRTLIFNTLTHLLIFLVYHIIFSNLVSWIEISYTWI